jgi:hypothetical protein
MQCWLAGSLRRFYPQSPAERRNELRLETVRGAGLSLQIVCRCSDAPATVSARVDAPEGIRMRVRRAGLAPVRHFTTETPAEELEGTGAIPGYVPDPLLPEATAKMGPWETTSFWVSIEAGDTVTPGEHRLTATLSTDAGDLPPMPIALDVHPATLRERTDFPVTHWLYADAIADWYRVDLFGEPFWRLLASYFRNLAKHRSDTIYVPLFTPPLDGVKRPTQLLGIAQDGQDYAFDWSLVDRWVATAREAGLSRFEWTHLFTQWGARHAIRIYHGHGEDGTLLWKPQTPATGETYHAFLSLFLPAFERYLRANDLLDRSFFHLSDEPSGAEHLETYRSARALLWELAPWMSVMDAMHEVDFVKEGLTDTPIALLPAVPDFQAEGLPVWAYFCCQPRGRFLNRMLDTPLTKIRMSGWIMYRLGVAGFLHWGYNYWYRRQTTELIDPFTVTDAHAWPNWGSGDPFVVYPGPDGPLDSIRWEIFAESLQDYALLQQAGIDRDDPLLAGIKDFADFPRDPDWIVSARAEVLALLS